MTRTRRPPLMLVVLCLLVLQLQLAAQVGLACRHAPDAPPGSLMAISATPTAACPMHAVTPDAPVPTADDPLDCPKCALDLALGAFQPAPPSFTPALVVPTTPTGACPGRHFYRFDPDAPLRPPIWSVS